MSTITTGEIVAGNIAEELSRRGWDLELLADATDVPMSKLASYADDASRMTMNELAAVASALGLRPSKLMTFDFDAYVEASPEGMRVLTMALDAINEARGTSHTVESVAESLGTQEPLSVAESSAIARHIGGVLML